MRKEIRIYLEGGGNGPGGKAALRNGFGGFLGDLKNRARGRRVRWQIVACGSRFSAFKSFRTALKAYPSAFNVLLVDAEGPLVSDDPWEHLRGRPQDHWANPGAQAKHCHLMVQVMEAWLIADPQTLSAYYGFGFQETALPGDRNVERVDKDRIERALAAATRLTQKGRYHKLQHAPEILKRIRASVVHERARYCRRMFDTLRAEIDGA